MDRSGAKPLPGDGSLLWASVRECHQSRRAEAVARSLGLLAVVLSELAELVDAAAVFVLPAVGGDVPPAVGPAAVGVCDVVGVG
jgi:hypothetical protein